MPASLEQNRLKVKTPIGLRCSPQKSSTGEPKFANWGSREVSHGSAPNTPNKLF